MVLTEAFFFGLSLPLALLVFGELKIDWRK